MSEHMNAKKKSTVRTEVTPAAAASGPPPRRLMAMDIYRGLAVAGMIIVDNPGSDDLAYAPIRHTFWNGWTPADLIFPSFLFIVGVSLVFSYSARYARGETRQSLLRHALIRSAALLMLGVVLNAFPTFELSTVRYEGVLQRIAICYLAAAILALWTGCRGQLTAILICLVGYWALLRFVSVPGFGVPGRDIPFLDPGRNLPAWLDRKFFMGHLYNGTRDPEGIIHSIPAIATTLIGTLTGAWLKSNRSLRKILGAMTLAGLGLLVGGLIWDRWFPINKNLWTSSFVLFSGGFALLAFALLFWVIEVKRWRAVWTIPLLVFGMNAIAGFTADALVGGLTYTYHVHRADGSLVLWQEYGNSCLAFFHLSPANTSLLYSLIVLAFCWLLLYLLYRKRIFLKF